MGISRICSVVIFSLLRQSGRCRLAMQGAVAPCGSSVLTLILHDFNQPGNGCNEGGHGRDNLGEVMEDFRRGHNAPVRLFRKVLI